MQEIYGTFEINNSHLLFTFSTDNPFVYPLLNNKTVLLNMHTIHQQCNLAKGQDCSACWNIGICHCCKAFLS
jgi:hypothetical protein